MPPTLTLGTQSWPLERGETTIGRQETCDIVIKDTSLSRAHATIHVAKDTVEVVDNNSSNGTYINGVRMAAGPLKNGDKLKLGSILFDFTWPESVVKVNVSPISQEQAQKLKESLTTQKQVAVDWKVPLMTTAGLGAFVTGVAAGLFGAMMGAGAGMVIAMAVGAVGAIATALMIRSLSAQRVQTPLRAFKDDLDLFFSGQKPDLEVIQGFPELNDSIHSVRLGSEILKERVANIYKLQLHEAQMAAQLHQAARDESGQRGFGAPMLGLDEQFRLQAWTPEARGMIRPDVLHPAGNHILQLMHNPQLGNVLLNTLSTTVPGAVQVVPRVAASPQDNRPLDLVVVHAAAGSPDYRFMAYLLPSP